MALKIHTKERELTLIDRGRGNEKVRWMAWRDGRPNTLGYGMIEQEAIDDLKYGVQPDVTGKLDGEGTPKGPVIGGNFLFSKTDIIEHNKDRLKK